MAKFSNRKFQEFSRHFQVPGRDKAPGLWDRSVHGKTKSADFAGLEKRHLENEGMTVQSVTKCQETWKLGTKHTRINRNISLYPCRCSSVDWKKHVRLEGVSCFFLCHLAKFVLFVLRIRWCNSPNICGQNWRRPKAPLMWFFFIETVCVLQAHNRERGWWRLSAWKTRAKNSLNFRGELKFNVDLMYFFGCMFLMSIDGIHFENHLNQQSVRCAVHADFPRFRKPSPLAARCRCRGLGSVAQHGPSSV